VTRSTRIRTIALAAVVALVPLLAVLVETPGLASPAGADNGSHKPSHRRGLFFASDGPRQDLVEKYAAQGVMPTMRGLLKNGASASGNGLLTQAPPNTGAGWYTLATGAWPGVTGSTNNTFHING
jgi:Type I phosphodiesterase / nucleotide pyrophosphatase